MCLSTRTLRPCRCRSSRSIDNAPFNRYGFDGGRSRVRRISQYTAGNKNIDNSSMRGLAHIGVLRVLAREKLQPELIVGTSAGAIVGALYASGLPVWTIEGLAARLGRSTLLDIAPWRIVLGGFGLGLARGDWLVGFLRKPSHHVQIQFVRLDQRDQVNVDKGHNPAVVPQHPGKRGLTCSTAGGDSSRGLSRR